MNKHSIVVLIIVVIAITAGFVVWKYNTPAPFTLEIIRRPRNPVGSTTSTLAIAGQRCIFLLVLDEEESLFQGSLGLGRTINFSVSDPGMMANLTIDPLSIKPGQIAEVMIIPSEESVNDTFSVIITAERNGVVRTKNVVIEVIQGEDDLLQHAEVMRDLFIPLLSENYSEFEITNDTEWVETIVNPRILVVMHYIFYTDDWEMYLTWHVTIPPHDWTRIYLRRRYTESQPSFAFEISSVKGQEIPHLIEVPHWV